MRTIIEETSAKVDPALQALAQTILERVSEVSV